MTTTGGTDPSTWVDAFLDAHREELVTMRRHLHAHPEASGEEHETTDLIVERLQAAGPAAPRAAVRHRGGVRRRPG